jgi:hypothetical protein
MAGPIRRNDAMVLGDAVAHGVLLWATCRACGHRAAVDPVEIAQRCGYDVPVRDVMPRLKCSRCGGREADLTANYDMSGHGQET